MTNSSRVKDRVILRGGDSLEALRIAFDRVGLGSTALRVGVLLLRVVLQRFGPEPCHEATTVPGAHAVSSGGSNAPIRDARARNAGPHSRLRVQRKQEHGCAVACCIDHSFAASRSNATSSCVKPCGVPQRHNRDCVSDSHAFI